MILKILMYVPSKSSKVKKINFLELDIFEIFFHSSQCVKYSRYFCFFLWLINRRNFKCSLDYSTNFGSGLHRQAWHEKPPGPWSLTPLRRNCTTPPRGCLSLPDITTIPGGEGRNGVCSHLVTYKCNNKNNKILYQK